MFYKNAGKDNKIKLQEISRKTGKPEAGFPLSMRKEKIMKNHIEITNFNDPNLDLYARLSEVQLLRYAEPKPGVFVAESPKVIGRALQAGYEPISFLLAHQDVDREAVEILLG